MSLLNSQTRALRVCTTFAILAGCSGGPQAALAPAAPPATTPVAAKTNETQAQALQLLAQVTPSHYLPAAHLNHRRSWMNPNVGSRPLLYASDASNGTVDVYDFKRPDTLLGQITGFQLPFGECSSGTGQVFVVDYMAAEIVEFKHGSTTPLKRLTDPSGSPIGCSVDPTTGDLAVANFTSPGSVIIYKKGEWYSYAIYGWTHYWPPGYDNQGNLFVQGLDDDNNRDFAELPAAGPSLREIPLNVTIYYPGSVMFDGTYMALTDQEYGGRQSQAGIYRVSVSGSTGTEISGIGLTDTCWPSGPFTVTYQPWIYDGNVVAGNLYCDSRFDYWNLTKGGNPRKVISSNIAPVKSYGGTVSL